VINQEFTTISGAFTAEQLSATLARYAPDATVWAAPGDTVPVPVSRVVVTAAARVELR
jgi:hypothetical protein